MTHPDNQSYFSAGELAALFGISKQTLLYYDKVNLLSPDFISENGYRHYSIQQYLDLEIIVNLRALNISIANIRKYLNNRTKADFLDIVSKKKADCEAIIKENEIIIKSLDVIYNNADKKQTHIFYQPLLSLYEERLLKVTNVYDADTGKDRIILFTKHSQSTFHNRKSLEKYVGWIITQYDLFDNPLPNATKAYFSFAPNTQAHKNALRTTLPAGMYVEIYFKDTFYKNAKRLSSMIDEFLEKNNLVPVGDVYILPIENHLFYSETDKYINKIFLNVVQK